MFLALYGHPEAADVTRRLNFNCFLHSIGFNGGRTVLFGGSKASRRLLSGAGGGAFSSAYMSFTRQLDLPLVGVDSRYKDLHSH